MQGLNRQEIEVLVIDLYHNQQHIFLCIIFEVRSIYVFDIVQFDSMPALF